MKGGEGGGVSFFCDFFWNFLGIFFGVKGGGGRWLRRGILEGRKRGNGREKEGVERIGRNLY